MLKKSVYFIILILFFLANCYVYFTFLYGEFFLTLLISIIFVFVGQKVAKLVSKKIDHNKN